VLDGVGLAVELEGRPRHLLAVDDGGFRNAGAAAGAEHGEHQNSLHISIIVPRPAKLRDRMRYSSFFSILALSAANRSSRSLFLARWLSLRSPSMLAESSWRILASSSSSSASASTASTRLCKRSNSSSADEPSGFLPRLTRALALSVSLRALTSLMRASS